MSLTDRVRTEIEELHVVFEAWLAGRGEASLDRVESALASDFEIVSPEGRLLERAPLLEGLGQARGRQGEGFRIEVRAVRARETPEGLVIATYEEWQWRPGEPERGRLSSALLRPRSAGGFDWLQVHETWLPR